MSQSFDYIKALTHRHGLTHDEVHADDKMPLGARIGGVITTQMTPHICA